MFTAVPAITSIPGFSEPFSAISHLAGLIVFGCIGPMLIQRGRGSSERVLSLLVLFITTEVLLAASMTYHLLEPGSHAREAILLRLDHAAIFMLIAGTLTSAHGILFLGWRRWAIIGFVWLFVAIVVPVKLIYWSDFSEGLGLALYLGFGWFGLISGILLYREHGLRFVTLIVAGGAAYSIGAIAEFARWPVLLPKVIESHEVFHLMVLLGIGLHWRFFWQIADRSFEAGVDAELALR